MPDLSSDQLEAFGREVKKARAFKGWTLDQLAHEALGRDNAKGYLSQIEKGKRQITARTAGKIIKALEMDEGLIAPFVGETEVDEDEVTKTDVDAERLVSRVQRETTGQAPSDALLIALAYEFAEGSHLDLQTAYQGLRSALEAAERVKARGEMPHNSCDQLQTVMQEVARLNDLDERDEAAERLDAEMNRVSAEKERLDAARQAIFELQLDQDRIRNRPELAAKRLIRDLHESAPPGGVWAATNELIDKWQGMGRDSGPLFELEVCLRLAQHNEERAKGPNVALALAECGWCHFLVGSRSTSGQHLTIAVKLLRKSLKKLTRDASPNVRASINTNLGAVMIKLAERSNDPARSRAAIKLLNASLQIYTRKSDPVAWAEIQINRGNALNHLGEAEGNASDLLEAVAAYKAALEAGEYRPGSRTWISVRHNLGINYRSIAILLEESKYLDRAEAAYRDALSQINVEKTPHMWANSTGGLGELALDRWTFDSDPQHLCNARSLISEARAVMVEGDEFLTAHTDELLAKIDEAEQVAANTD